MKLSNTVSAFASCILALSIALNASAALPPGTSAGAPPASHSPYDPTKPASAVVGPNPATLSKLVPDKLQTGSRSFLWEVKSKTNVMYLFGTVHVGKREFYPLPTPVEEAFKQSQRLVVEADISNNDGMADIGAIINYKAPDGLDKHIPAALFDRLKTQLALLNVPVEAVKPMKPYLIGGFLSVAAFSQLGYDINLGVDGYLIGKAKEQGKPILELESQAGQLQMLDGLSPILQVAFLENAIRTLESGKAAEQVTGVVNAWQTGDVNLMQEVTRGVNKQLRLTEQLDEVLLHRRHDAMLRKMESYLRGSVPHFVAVGSLHLIGPRGLVEMLRSRGFEVKQL